MKMWMIRVKDVCTAFLNADYIIKGEMLLLKPPYIYVKAGLVEPDAYWLVKKAIFGFKESPLLWSKERDHRLEKLVIKIERTKSKKSTFSRSSKVTQTHGTF